jgi:hypothetical protein
LLCRDKATFDTLVEAAKMACPGWGKTVKRRSKAGDNAIKSARHKLATVKRRRTPPKAVLGRGSATTTLETEIARLTRERQLEPRFGWCHLFFRCNDGESLLDLSDRAPKIW